MILQLALKLAVDDVAVADLRGNDPRSWHKLIVAALEKFGVAEARSVVQTRQDLMAVDSDWLTWVNALIDLTGDGRLPQTTHRPPPDTARKSFVGRVAQADGLNGFLDRLQEGRGGLALVLGPPGIGKSRLLVEVLASRPSDAQVEWVTFDRGEAGYRGWRRLLAPLWITLRRTELAPAGLLRHVGTLDNILLPSGDSDPTGRLLPGDVAAAVAALLDHAAGSAPVVIVIDDAHRGGTSSDRLLLDVARLVSACAVGIVGALRPEELEEGSPVLGYCDQAEGRVALDTVVPIRLPPFGVSETADLLRERTGVEFPQHVVERVMRLTDGCPQLIDNTPIQAVPGGVQATSWVLGKLRAEGLRVLDATIQSRTAETRDVLRAAALSAVGRFLDKERERGPILAPVAAGYGFQHDN